MGSVLWIGPVTRGNLAGVALPAGWSLYVLNDTPGGIASSAFRALGASLGGLDGLLGHMGAPRGPAALFCFSAGGGLVDEILKRDALDPRVRAVVGCDAYYSMHASYPEIKTGWLAGGRAAVARRYPLLLTTSSTAGPDYYDSQTSARPLSEALRLQTRPAPGWSRLSGAPPRYRAAGGAGWLAFGDRFSHVEHATRVAPAVLRAWSAGALSGRGGAEAGLFVAVAAVAAAAYAAQKG